MLRKNRRKKEMKTEMRCPKCGRELVEAADWPDDWLVCLNCLHSQKLESGEGTDRNERLKGTARI